MGLELTPACDLFSLGAMLHRLLDGLKRTASEFYAIFPERSYLDAAGSSPEELPTWSRDLIVSLTARDPNRRPRSAAAVGRILLERLGIAVDPREFVDELRWPPSFGRDAWVAEWTEALDRVADVPWIRTPPGEDPRPFWQHLRLQASLRGRTLQGLDLAGELAAIEDGVALDEWLARTVEQDVEWIAVLASELDAWKKRALESLERASALRRSGRGGAPRLFVVSDEAPPGVAFRVRAVPAVTEEAVARYLERPLAAEAPSRRTDFAARLAAAARGSASRLDRVLRAAQTAAGSSRRTAVTACGPASCPTCCCSPRERTRRRRSSRPWAAPSSKCCRRCRSRVDAPRQPSSRRCPRSTRATSGRRSCACATRAGSRATNRRARRGSCAFRGARCSARKPCAVRTGAARRRSTTPARV
jgi:hypothetical protein